MYSKTTKWRDMLKKHRFMHDLSIRAMAERVGMTSANYFLLEKGERTKPKLETFTALSIELNMPVEKLKEIYFESYFTKH